MKEFARRRTGSEIRVLPVFDPWRSAILLIAVQVRAVGPWYRMASRRAEQLYADF